MVTILLSNSCKSTSDERESMSLYLWSRSTQTPKPSREPLAFSPPYGVPIPRVTPSIAPSERRRGHDISLGLWRGVFVSKPQVSMVRRTARRGAPKHRHGLLGKLGNLASPFNGVHNLNKRSWLAAWAAQHIKNKQWALRLRCQFA